MNSSSKFQTLTMATAVALFFVSESTEAQIVFEDGSVNVVDSILSEYIVVRNSSMGTPTTVRIQTGANIPNFDPDGQDTSIIVEGSSIVDMSDGMTVGGFNTFENATGFLSGGIVGDEAEVHGNSMMTIGTAEGGMVPDIQDDLETFNNGIVDMFDGRVFDDVEANDSSVINFFGGEFDEDVEAFDNSVINIFGGIYSTGFGDLDDIEGGKIEVQDDDEGNVNTALNQYSWWDFCWRSVRSGFQDRGKWNDHDFWFRFRSRRSFSRFWPDRRDIRSINRYAGRWKHGRQRFRTHHRRRCHHSR